LSYSRVLDGQASLPKRKGQPWEAKTLRLPKKSQQPRISMAEFHPISNMDCLLKGLGTASAPLVTLFLGYNLGRI
jgi:hypothetical protein